MASLLSGTSPTYLVDFAVSPGYPEWAGQVAHLIRQAGQGRVGRHSKPWSGWPG